VREMSRFADCTPHPSLPRQREEGAQPLRPFLLFFRFFLFSSPLAACGGGWRAIRPRARRVGQPRSRKHFRPPICAFKKGWPMSTSVLHRTADRPVMPGDRALPCFTTSRAFPRQNGEEFWQRAGRWAVFFFRRAPPDHGAGPGPRQVVPDRNNICVLLEPGSVMITLFGWLNDHRAAAACAVFAPPFYVGCRTARPC